MSKKFGATSWPEIVETDLHDNDHLLINDKSEDAVKRIRIAELKKLMRGLLDGSGAINYDQTTGEITLSPLSSDDIQEGATNKYFSPSQFDSYLGQKSTDSIGEGIYIARMHKDHVEVTDSELPDFGSSPKELIQDIPNGYALDVISIFGVYHYENAPIPNTGGKIQLYYESSGAVVGEIDSAFYTASNNTVQQGTVLSPVHQPAAAQDKLMVKFENATSVNLNGAKGDITIHIAYRFINIAP